MSAVETKAPGTFTRGIREKFSDEKVGRMSFHSSDLRMSKQATIWL